MYTIEENDDHILVKFEDSFDYPMARTVFRHLTGIRQYPHTNDIWVIGRHTADIRLGELENMVQEFQYACPAGAQRTKTAVVVAEGLTGAILELFVKAMQKRVSYKLRIFRTLEEAQAWLGVAARRQTA